MTVEEIGAICNAIYTRAFLQLLGYADFGSTSGTNVEVTINIETTGMTATSTASQDEDKPT